MDSAQAEEIIRLLRVQAVLTLLVPVLIQSAERGEIDAETFVQTVKDQTAGIDGKLS